MKRWLPVVPVFLLLCGLATANNLQISNVSLASVDTVNNQTFIRFDVSWENSWRDMINWDAAWIFVKYSTDLGLTWNHAWLNPLSGNHTIPAGVSLSVGATNVSGTDRGMGVFLYRSTAGSGTNTWSNVYLRWEYGLNGINDNTPVMVRMFGIEMVYAEQGSYYLGDGTSSMIAAQFEAGNTGQPFLVTSEAALTLGGTSPTNLSNHNNVGILGNNEDFNYATTQALGAVFPKGYAAYYAMKYEITQDQYKDFLNTLTRTQQGFRVVTNITGTAIVNRFVMTNSAIVSNRNGIRCDATIPATNPITFFCDFDADGVYNETVDGQTIAADNLSPSDALAYFDWSALRPMSELEFEKLCRGPVVPQPNEYAWGDTVSTNVTGVLNSGGVNEIASNAGANNNSGGLSAGPIRVGAFATSASSRRDAGASYYGAMDLSGNCSEMIVAISSIGRRTYNPIHGDGVLSSGGAANTGWPTLDARGTAFSTSSPAYGRISDRSFVAFNLSRSGGNGARGVRTAP
jgi:hypothetical protein